VHTSHENNILVFELLTLPYVIAHQEMQIYQPFRTGFSLYCRTCYYGNSIGKWGYGELKRVKPSAFLSSKPCTIFFKRREIVKTVESCKLSSVR